MSRKPSRASRKAANLWGGTWAVGTLVALAATLPTLGRGDFGGLNNVPQIPFAFPWLLVFGITGDERGDPWVLAALGLVNACLIYLFVLWRTVHRSLRSARVESWSDL